MRIGILTYHRSHNYGAVLQAYATKYFLIKNGYTGVEFVDYFPDYHHKMYANIRRKSFKALSLKGKIKYPYYLIRYFLPLYFLKEIRRQKFNKFIKKYLINKSIDFSKKEYDSVIYGSDQIWRKQKRETCPGFNEMYFGIDTIKAKKRIAFSASMGVIDLGVDDKKFLKQNLKNFDYISVRERQLYDVIKALTTKEIRHTLDPVFLLDKNEWDRIIPKRIINGKYLLLYNLQNDKNCEEVAKIISSKTGYQIIKIIGEINKKRYLKGERATDGPNNFLALFRDAEFVVTSSFHGVAFSIVFQKQFYTVLPRNTQRIKSLLKICDIENRRINNIPETDFLHKIEYTQVNRLLNREIDFSKFFLLNALKM